MGKVKVKLPCYDVCREKSRECKQKVSEAQKLIDSLDLGDYPGVYILNGCERYRPHIHDKNRCERCGATPIERLPEKHPIVRT